MTSEALVSAASNAIPPALSWTGLDCTATLVISGVRALHPTHFTTIPDRIEAGTFLSGYPSSSLPRRSGCSGCSGLSAPPDYKGMRDKPCILLHEIMRKIPM
eukprot:7411319-Pyramimonas_sp.AAC.1